MFEYDWQNCWTVEQAEKELQGFEWKGPGVYNHGFDSMIVIPVNRSSDEIWHTKLTEINEKFNFYIFNNRRVADLISVLSQAPTRT